MKRCRLGCRLNSVARAQTGPLEPRNKSNLLNVQIASARILREDSYCCGCPKCVEQYSNTRVLASQAQSRRFPLRATLHPLPDSKSLFKGCSRLQYLNAPLRLVSLLRSSINPICAPVGSSMATIRTAARIRRKFGFQRHVIAVH